jgi:cytochrome d ubiquinol oxidase subunit II
MTYTFLQQYWWAIISLLGALLVLMLFVQGGNTLLFQLGRTEEERRMMLRATGRKWELTFTTLVTFGGAFFASFPLFYSTSFGGAYWLWMLLLFSFVLQAVSYEFQAQLGNLLGANTYRLFLIINGEVAPLLLGVAVATFFTGANFVVVRENICDAGMPVISRWANATHGIDALYDVRNWLLGVALFFLARVLGELYYMQRIDCEAIVTRSRKSMVLDAPAFLVALVAFLIVILTSEGYAVADTGRIYMEPYKYLHNLLEMPVVAALLLLGVAGVLYGLWRTLLAPGREAYRDGIFPVGAGVVLTVFALFLTVGYHQTAYYPSAVDPQSSLTLANSSASEFTLRTMFYVSLLVPFVVAYIVYVWRALEDRRIDADEVREA